jgi:hypothetical protein
MIRPMCDCLLWAVYWILHAIFHILGLFFPRSEFCINFDTKWVGRLFHKLIWSPCLGTKENLNLRPAQFFCMQISIRGLRSPLSFAVDSGVSRTWANELFAMLVNFPSLH